MKYSFGFCIFLLGVSKAVTTSTLTATLNTDCACYGNDETIDSIMPNCTTSGDVIAIKSVYRAAKFSNSSCPNIATAADRDEATCCTFNSAEDCQINLSADDPTTVSVFTDCAGAASCSKRATWQDTLTSCGAGFLTQTNFMCMEYYCFPSSDTAPFCDTSGTTYTGSQLYFFNDDYPLGISNVNCCSCVVTATASSATIDVNIIDFRLYDETTTCVQALLVDDGTSFTSYNCSNNNKFAIQKLMTSSTNSVTVTLQNSETTTNGYMWIGVTVSNGGLTMTCGSVSQCPDGSTTTTATTTVDTTTTTSSQIPALSADSTGSSDDDETLLFDLSVLHSILVLAGALFLLLCGTVICCCIGYKLGKNKSYDLNKQKKKTTNTGQSNNKRSTHPPYCVQSSQHEKPHIKPRTTITEGRSPDISKNTMFTYRQFDNRYQTSRKGRRSSLPRVDSY